ncbi:IS630 family transposase [Methanoculleus sp. FWC-SCC1]|uniref:IS630 family transposase n=1 Tax=Methanoculleus frigidifontis TaxID=2584085 RepID=A0ABT8MBN6_9EURY|nr:IS630 family transposase [Methanoculleus sp. FWC-SCC1]MDN7025357.1 IS630 family transposase [Methanoculleus sp. FWC-SCC1]
MSKHTVLGFLDECSPQTTANTQRMWSFDHTPLVKNTKKIRANTFAILAVKGTSIVTFRERSKQEDVREVLRAYRKANPKKRLVIVLDNFKSHHAILVRQYAAGNNIRLAYLPPYSPDLNPIEQIWRAIKREVSATFVRDYEHMTVTIARAFERLAAKRTYWEKWVQKFLSPKYASRMLSQ